MLTIVILFLSFSIVDASAVKCFPVNPMMRIREDFTPIGNSLQYLQIIAPRNGVASGQIIVISDTALKDLSVSISEFISKTGYRISKERIKIRFALLGKFGGDKWFDGLSEKFVPGNKIQPVWITIDVPANAVAGEYEGQLSINGVITLIRLKVSEFVLPDKKDRVMWVSMSQSPETVALQYEVPFYSDRHWQLLEKSLKLQGDLADKVLYIPAIGKTWFGNEHSMIVFKQQNNEFIPDFSIVEKYMNLYIKYCGNPRAVILDIWEPYMFKDEKNPNPFLNKVWISVIKPQGFEVVEIEKYPQKIEMWKGILNGMITLLKRYGLSPKVLRIGISSDANVDEETVNFFKNIVPDITWAIFTHGYGGPPRYIHWTYGEFPDNTTENKVLRFGWDCNPDVIVMNTVRDQHTDTAPPETFRRIPDKAVGIHRGRRSIGLARVGLDFWSVIKVFSGKYWKYYNLIGRFPENRVNRLYRCYTASVTIPGPDGAMATQRYEMLREGIQDAEARIVVERAFAANLISGNIKEEAEKILLKYSGIMVKRREEISLDEFYSTIEALYDIAGKIQRTVKSH